MSLHLLIRTGAVLLALGAPLAACGKLGELERPGAAPKGGNSSDRQAEEQRRQAQDPQRPVDTVDTRDISTDPAPPRTIPIPSSGQDPSAQPPQGALGNPFANPR